VPTSTSVPASVFDAQIEQWRCEADLPWYRIKRRQVQVNLARHLAGSSLRILDAGGGNGLDSLPLAAQGHHVVIVDYSQAMLADAQARADAAGLLNRIELQQADVAGIGNLFPGDSFDAVLCHNVIQYLPTRNDQSALLSGLGGLLKHQGVLSLVSLNRLSAVYAELFLRGNPAAALQQIDTDTVQGIMFNAPMLIHSVQEACDMVENVGLVAAADYGLLCVTPYWGNNAAKYDPAVYEQLEALELALSDKQPYKVLARHYQVIAQRH
jgi:S-adenosylmethionine-dependent methyltransferase